MNKRPKLTYEELELELANTVLLFTRQGNTVVAGLNKTIIEQKAQIAVLGWQNLTPETQWEADSELGYWEIDGFVSVPWGLTMANTRELHPAFKYFRRLNAPEPAIAHKKMMDDIAQINSNHAAEVQRLKTRIDELEAKYAFQENQAICVGYKGDCDGDLEAEPHEPHCPAHSRDQEFRPKLYRKVGSDE